MKRLLKSIGLGIVATALLVLAVFLFISLLIVIFKASPWSFFIFPITVASLFAYYEVFNE